ncbi:MAG: carboxypeptidase-like regulatory domain-containing protein [Cytophagaceae bacterium]|nr:carboxypeptidase-like regulatory domain-containing protein [Cytophagaceae bacterium]
MKNGVIVGCLLLFICGLTGAQVTQVVPRKVIQFTGIIVSGDSAYGVPGVYVYVPKEGRGTMSNGVGYFSMPTLTGDTIMIKSVGFKDKTFVIPASTQDKLSVIIEIFQDTIYMPTVVITPWPTEELFKQAFLALNLPSQELENMNGNLNEQVLRRVMSEMGASSSMNYRYYMNQQALYTQNQYMSPTLSLTNPFAWKRFINDVKSGQMKKTYDQKYVPEGE